MKQYFPYFSAALILILVVGSFGWFIYEQEKLVEVTLIKIVETNPNEGAWTRRPTYGIYERTDTHQRVTSYVYGREGETFRLKKKHL